MWDSWSITGGKKTKQMQIWTWVFKSGLFTQAIVFSSFSKACIAQEEGSDIMISSGHHLEL